MSLFCAIDLHSDNSVVVVIDDQDNVVLQQRLPNDIQLIERALTPFQSDLHGVAVESKSATSGSGLAFCPFDTVTAKNKT